MYVYIQSEKGTGDNNYTPLYTVGFFDPTGRWHPDSDHTDKRKAAKRVAFLNGANVSFEP